MCWALRRIERESLRAGEECIRTCFIVKSAFRGDKQGRTGLWIFRRGALAGCVSSPVAWEGRTVRRVVGEMCGGCIKVGG